MCCCSKNRHSNCSFIHSFIKIEIKPGTIIELESILMMYLKKMAKLIIMMEKGVITRKNQPLKYN